MNRVEMSVQLLSVSSLSLTQTCVIILEWARPAQQTQVLSSPFYLLIHSSEIIQWPSYSLIKVVNVVERKTASIWFERKTHTMSLFEVRKLKTELYYQVVIFFPHLLCGDSWWGRTHVFFNFDCCWKYLMLTGCSLYCRQGAEWFVHIILWILTTVWK